jgi:hypothetical protein
MPPQFCERRWMTLDAELNDFGYKWNVYVIKGGRGILYVAHKIRVAL